MEIFDAYACLGGVSFAIGGFSTHGLISARVAICIGVASRSKRVSGTRLPVIASNRDGNSFSSGRFMGILTPVALIESETLNGSNGGCALSFSLSVDRFVGCLSRSSIGSIANCRLPSASFFIALA